MKKLLAALLILMLTIPAIVFADDYYPGGIPESYSGGVYWDTQFKPETSTKNDKVFMLKRLSDNNPATVFNYTQWKSEKTDEIPELTAYPGGITLTAIGVRNGNVNSIDDYYMNARLRSFRVLVYCSEGVIDQTFSIQDEYTPDYQIFKLRQTCTNVSQIDFFFTGSWQGDTETWNVCISDIYFYRDNSYSYPTYITAPPAVTPVPVVVTQVPTPVYTPGWVSGCSVSVDQYNTLRIDMTGYAANGCTIVCFSRNSFSSTASLRVISDGLSIMETLTPGIEYEYAIWCGDYSTAMTITRLSVSRIPETAWIKLRVTEDHKLTILSTSTPITFQP